MHRAPSSRSNDAMKANDRGRLPIWTSSPIFARRSRCLSSHGEELWIEICGRPVPAKNTPQGIRAVHGAAAIDPHTVERYLQQKFGENLGPVRSAMQRLAKSYDRQTLADVAYSLY